MKQKYKLVARVDGNGIEIGTEKEMNKELPKRKFVVWKTLTAEELGKLLMGLQEGD